MATRDPDKAPFSLLGCLPPWAHAGSPGAAGADRGACEPLASPLNWSCHCPQARSENHSTNVCCVEQKEIVAIRHVYMHTPICIHVYHSFIYLCRTHTSSLHVYHIV